jgi:hypothetical protein
MTIQTSFDYIIATPEDEQANYPRHLIDTEQLNNVEQFVVVLEFLDDADDCSTVSSYSDDDSSIESSLEIMEGNSVDFSADDFEIPLAGTTRSRERRGTARRRLEEMMDFLGLEPSLLAGRRESPEEYAVDLARNRVRNERTRYVGDMVSFDAEDDSSLRLTRTRGVPLLRRTRRDQDGDQDDDNDEEDDSTINICDSSMPLATPSRPRGSTIFHSSSSDSLWLARTRGVPLLRRTLSRTLI